MDSHDRMAQRSSRPDDVWLEAFHGGERACMEECYRTHVASVDQAVGAILKGADRETVIHEVFFRLLTEESFRRRFQGGSLATWLRVVARNQAIDHARHHRREILTPDPAGVGDDEKGQEDPLDQRADVRLTLRRFRAEVLPPKWDRVFMARFVEQQDQRDAARALRIPRTTLVYQEHRIRTLLRRFVLKGEPT